MDSGHALAAIVMGYLLVMVALIMILVGDIVFAITASTTDRIISHIVIVMVIIGSLVGERIAR